MTTTILTPELLDQLLAGYERPEDLTGADGLFRRLKKALIERALEALARSHIFDHTLTQRTDSFSLAHGCSILSEGWNTSILRVGLSSATTILSTGYQPLDSCSRAAGWSAATLCIGSLLTCSLLRACPLLTVQRTRLKRRREDMLFFEDSV